AKQVRLGQTAPLRARLVLPPPSALLPNGPQVLSARVRRSRAVALRPDLGIPARWDHGFSAPLLDRLVAAPFVIGAIGTDLADLTLHRRQQVGQSCIIGH